MPMTISYLSILNDQLPAKQSRNIFAMNKIFVTKSHVQHDLFVSEPIDENGSCFIWSTNVLVSDAWLPINCSTKVAYPFRICEKKLKTNETQLFYQRQNIQCTLKFLEFNGFCIRIFEHFNNRRVAHLKWDAKNI